MTILKLSVLCGLSATILASRVAGQTMPSICRSSLAVVPRFDSVVQLGPDQRERTVVDSALSYVVSTPGGGVPPVLQSLMQEDSAGALIGLAEAVADPTRYGTTAASVAADLYSRLGAKAQPMLMVLQANLDVARRPLGLAVVGHLEPDQKPIVIGFACEAIWQLLPFIAEREYAKEWTETRFEYWPDLALRTLREAVRLLGKDTDSFHNVLEKLQQSPLRPTPPLIPS